MYIETSAHSRGSKARLISPAVTPNQQGQKCLKFWYHMYGQNVDSLNVYIQFGLSIPSSAYWNKKGTQGNSWKQQSLTITASKVFNVSNLYLGP